jgi:carbon storage regulator
MLVLGRKEAESIQIGDDVTVVVTRIGPGRRVRIGIVAPPHVAVVRSELLTEGECDVSAVTDED